MYEFYAQAAGVKVQVLEKQDMQLCRGFDTKGSGMQRRAAYFFKSL